jgi:hypothetical protein
MNILSLSQFDMLGKVICAFIFFVVAGSFTSTAFAQSAPQNCDNMKLSTTVSHASKNQANGSLKVEIKGGTSPYQIHWLSFNFSSSGEEIKNLKPGHYSVVVVDSNKCISRVDNIKIELK